MLVLYGMFCDLPAAFILLIVIIQPKLLSYDSLCNYPD